MKKERILLFWNGGSASALALHKLQTEAKYEIAGLICLINRATNRVPYHGIPDVLILEQGKLLKLPVQRIFIDPSSPTESSEIIKFLKMFAKTNIAAVAFPDTQSKERNLHETICKESGLLPLFPLWSLNAEDFNKEFFTTGHKALVTGINKDVLTVNHLALEYNETYIENLPAEVNAAGLNGEFNTFVTFGPSFKMRVPFSKSIAVDEDNYLVSLMKEP